MKKITQERILKALDKNYEYYHSHPEPKIIQILSKIGFKYSLYQRISNNKITIKERQKMELSYHGFYDRDNIIKRLSRCKITRTERIEDIWFQSWDWLEEKKRKREQKILDIQCKYRISGLEEQKDFVDGELIESHTPHSFLRLIEEDYETLRAERLKALEIFLRTIRVYEMPLYEVKTDLNGKENWIKTTSELVINIVKNYNWADISENMYYVNSKDLSNELSIIEREKQKKVPESYSDKFIRDLYLYTGNGDPSESEDSSFYCARIVQ